MSLTLCFPLLIMSLTVCCLFMTMSQSVPVCVDNSVHVHVANSLFMAVTLTVPLCSCHWNSVDDSLLTRLCAAGPRGRQMEGDECPLHVQHPPTGEEFALGCGVCRNAHTF